MFARRGDKEQRCSRDFSLAHSQPIDTHLVFQFSSQAPRTKRFSPMEFFSPLPTRAAETVSPASQRANQTPAPGLQRMYSIASRLPPVTSIDLCEAGDTVSAARVGSGE